MEIRQQWKDMPLRRMEALADATERIRLPGRRRVRHAEHVVHGNQHPRSAGSLYVQAEHERPAPGLKVIHPPGTGPGWRDVHAESHPGTPGRWIHWQGLQIQLQHTGRNQGSERRLHQIRKRGRRSQDPEAPGAGRRNRPGSTRRDTGIHQRGTGQSPPAGRLDLFRQRNQPHR